MSTKTNSNSKNDGSDADIVNRKMIEKNFNLIGINLNEYNFLLRSNIQKI